MDARRVTAFLDAPRVLILTPGRVKPKGAAERFTVLFRFHESNSVGAELRPLHACFPLIP